MSEVNAQAKDRGIPTVSDSLLAEIMSVVRGPSLALMLYGSQARGSADHDSDVDVLQIAYRRAGSYSDGRVSVTVYTPRHLRKMAERGSLFVLHLRAEGIELEDPNGVLRDALSAYQAPRSYDSLLAELRSAARAVAIKGIEFDALHEELGRLGIYLIRTWLYLENVKVGITAFEVSDAAAAQTDQEVLEVLRLRRAKSLSYDDSIKIQAKVMKVFEVESEESKDLSELVRELAAEHPHASALIQQVFEYLDTLNYADMPLPPL
ncbi:hypothetical protein ACIBJI_35175 [Nocardia sp. NPDC050408]|uniref:hypothetical protein n=1 Tax=Nocardia sp. NPDC050408 TaxID=3364319 RepID=UPI0037B7675C